MWRKAVSVLILSVLCEASANAEQGEPMQRVFSESTIRQCARLLNARSEAKFEPPPSELKPNKEVTFQRDGRIITGRVESVEQRDGGFYATVAWEEEGNIYFKEMPASEVAVTSTAVIVMRGVSTTKFVLEALLRTMQIYKLFPKHNVQVEDVNYGMTDLFDIGGGRKAVLAFIKKNGSTSFRVIYSSNSQGMYRVLPALAPSHYSKGLGEDTLNLPSQVQAFLSQQVVEGQVRTDVPQKIINDAIPEFESGFGMQVGVRLDRDNLIPSRKITDPESPMMPPNSSGRSYEEPRTLRLTDPQLKPNYKVEIRSYHTQTAVAGPVIARIFHSLDGSLEYTIMEEQSGRIWIAQIQDLTAPLNEIGLRSRAINAGSLTMPLYEYFSQAPFNYGEGAFGPSNTYTNVWNYLMLVPVIQRYYLDRGLQVPRRLP